MATTAEQYRVLIRHYSEQLDLASRAGDARKMREYSGQILICREKLRFIEKGPKMSNNTEEEDSLIFRIVVAILATLGVAYAVYLFFDIQNGWGQGWVILAAAGVIVVALILLIVLLSVWVWVYNGLPHRLHARQNRK